LPSLLEAFLSRHSSQREAKMHLPPAVGLGLSTMQCSVIANGSLLKKSKRKPEDVGGRLQR
jgi:hypothetical protein